MTFRTQLQDDAKNCFMNTDEFAETISYTPYGGSARSITAVIVRDPLQRSEQDGGRIAGREFEIFILNDATYGVSSVLKGQDKVSFPVHLGETAVSFVVADIISKDDAVFHLRAIR